MTSRLDRRKVKIQRIQWARRGANGHVGDVQIARRGFQVGVAEQDLNGTEVRAGFQQVRGKSVPQGVIMMLTISFSLRSAIAITRATEQRSNLFAI